MLLQLAVLLATVSDIALSSCSYVEADFIAMNKFKLGTFTFAMSKCQGLAIKMPKPLSLTLDGSIKFKLINGRDVYAYVFSDPYCTILSQQSPTRPNPVKIGTTGTSSTVNLDLFGQRIPGGLKFVIKKIQSSASQSVCGLSMAAARDCTWGRSDFYLNVSMPTGQCVDAKMGQGPMMVPGGVANNLNKKFSVKMDCCQDGSLRLTNFTGFGCTAASKLHSDIIPASYNGQCLNLTQPMKRRRLLGERSSILMNFVYSKLFGDDGQQESELNVGRKLLQHGRHHGHGHGGGGVGGSSSSVPPPPVNQLIFELRWECSALSGANCNGMKKLTSSQLPPKCSSTCQLKSESWWSKMVKWYRHRSTSQPGYPIDWRHWRTTVKGRSSTASSSNGASATDQNMPSKQSDLSGIDVAAIILSVVFFLVLVGAMVYCCIMKKMDRNVNQLSRRSYAPMMEDGASELEQQNSNAVQV